MPRWTFELDGDPVALPTEFSQYEGAIARTLALPLLIVVQSNLLRRVVFDSNFGPYIGTFPPNADKTWLDSPKFRVPFKYRQDEMRLRRDVFLGYSGGSTTTAALLREFLEKDVGATVLDWQRDFSPADRS
jgi:hypothetical protein